MTAVVSVWWRLAPLAGPVLGNGLPVRTRLAPEVSRAYFLVALTPGHNVVTFENTPDVVIEYFVTSEEAMRWSEWDIERRMEIEEE